MRSIGMEILPSEGEIFLLTSDGKAKRLEHTEFPPQGRYGKGVRVWSLPAKVRLAGLGGGKPHHVGTIHLSKGAAKSTRLDAAAIRKREFLQGRCGRRAQAGRGSRGLHPGLDRRSLRAQGGGREEEGRGEEGGKGQRRSAKTAPGRPLRRPRGRPRRRKTGQ